MTFASRIRPRWGGITLQRRGFTVAAVLLMLGHLSPAEAQTSDLRVAITSSANPVVQGGRITWTLVVTNHGLEDAVDVTAVVSPPREARQYIDVIPAPGWTATTSISAGGCYLEQCSVAYAAFRTSTLPRGASAALSVVQDVLHPPGATVEAVAYVTTLPPIVPFRRPEVPTARATVTVEGSGPVPSAPSQLSVVNSTSTDVVFDTVRVAFAPEIAAYVAVGSDAWTDPAVALLDGSGALVGPLMALDLGPHEFISVAPPASAGPSILAWTASDPDSLAHVFTGTLTLSGMIPAVVNVGAAGRGVVNTIAHATSSRVSLMTYNTYSADYREGRLWAQRVDAEGRPVGGAIEIARRGAQSQVEWNPVTNEFGVTYTTTHDFPEVETADFARIGPDGTVRQRMRLGRVSWGRIDLAVNDRTGAFIVVWTDSSGDHFAAEISRTGRLVSRGAIARRDQLLSGRSVAYHPLSGTFLVADSNGRALELNQHGAPLSLPIPPAISMSNATVGVRPDVPEWIVVGGTYVSALGGYTLKNEIVRTGSIDGGSDLRLGGCVTPDPFAALGGGVCYDSGWLPPGIAPPGFPVSGGCATPDPFVALGGGICVNDGWLPPGMTPPGMPAPAACTTRDPFVAIGGGVCVNGGWVPATHPLARPATLSCAGLDPFAVLGGGVCVNGGWVPATHPLAPPAS